MAASLSHDNISDDQLMECTVAAIEIGQTDLITQQLIWNRFEVADLGELDREQLLQVCAIVQGWAYAVCAAAELPEELPGSPIIHVIPGGKAG